MDTRNDGRRQARHQPWTSARVFRIGASLPQVGVRVSPVPSLTRAAAHERAASIRVDAYDVDLDLTAGDERFASTTTISFRASSPGLSTFVEVRPHTLRSATLNGIPLNDAEDQGAYFVDLPDLASSVDNIQIQRGVGTSTNGAGAFGASINIQTATRRDTGYIELNNTVGSYSTVKNTISMGTGLLGGKFSFDGRLSRIESNGYIDRSASDLKSYFFTGAYYGKKSVLRLNVFSGYEKTYQAWNGIPQAKWDGNQAALEQHYQNNVGSLYFNQQDSLNLFRSSNKTYNYFTYKDQTDNYWQNHYQLFFNHQFSDALAFNSAVFLTRGYGYFQEYHDQGDLSNASYSAYALPPVVMGTDTLQSTNLVRQRWLDNYFYGSVLSLQYKKNNTELMLGGGWDRYDGKHYGNVIWAANGGSSPQNGQAKCRSRGIACRAAAPWRMTSSMFIPEHYKKTCRVSTSMLVTGAIPQGCPSWP